MLIADVKYLLLKTQILLSRTWKMKQRVKSQPATECSTTLWFHWLYLAKHTFSSGPQCYFIHSYISLQIASDRILPRFTFKKPSDLTLKERQIFVPRLLKTKVESAISLQITYYIWNKWATFNAMYCGNSAVCSLVSYEQDENALTVTVIILYLSPLSGTDKIHVGLPKVRGLCKIWLFF